ncbi:MAG TPA: S41 family peptidase, partial [Pyrinomonadaceae bacterium]
QQSGRYAVTDVHIFAERITEDLKDVANDKHLWLSYDLPAYTAALAPPESVEGQEAFRRRRAVRNNHGLTEMRILPGNVRYLKIIHFEWVLDETGAIYDKAMRFLKDGDAWIVDLRGNIGGTTSAVNYFGSHFHAPGTFNYTLYGGSETPERNYALEYLPAGRLKGKPFYILIDGSVGSAAEAAAYDLQQFKIAEMVGAKSAGAANNNKLLPIAPGFILSISYGRPVHILTNTNWEGVGIKPNIECDPNVALDSAQSLALKRLAEQPGVSTVNLSEYNWALTEVEARLRPVTLTSAQMKAWTGRFTSADYGEAKVSLIDGVLWFERPNRPRARLVPLTANGLFAIDGNDLLRARLTGKTLELLWRGEPSPRIFVSN